MAKYTTKEPQQFRLTKSDIINKTYFIFRPYRHKRQKLNWNGSALVRSFYRQGRDVCGSDARRHSPWSFCMKVSVGETNERKFLILLWLWHIITTTSFLFNFLWAAFIFLRNNSFSHSSVNLKSVWRTYITLVLATIQDFSNLHISHHESEKH